MTFFLPPNRLTYLATAKLLGLQLQCAAHVGTTRQIEFHYSWIYSTWELTFQTHSNLWNISFGRWENVCICFFNEHQKLAWNPSWFFWWGPFQLCWDEKILFYFFFFKLEKCKKSEISRWARPSNVTIYIMNHEWRFLF